MVTSAAPRWHGWLAAVAVFVGALAFQALRIPGLEHDVVWAEDGAVFLPAALQDPLGSLLAPYAGYQHLLPRVLAGLIVGIAPLEAYAIAVFWVSAVVAALVCAATIRLASWTVPWLPARIGLGMIPVVLPLMAPEIIGNLADMHTYALWLGVWIALSKPASRAEAWAWAAAALLATLTEVQLVLLLPVVLARLHIRRPLLWPIIASVVLGIVVQLLTWLLTPRPGYGGVAIGVPDVVVGWLANAVMPTLQPAEEQIRDAFAAAGPVAALPLLLPFALAAVAALVWGDRPARGACAVVLLASACSFGGSLLASPTEAFQYASLHGEAWLTAIVDLRYGGAAGMLLAAVVPIAASVLAQRATGRLRVPLRIVLVIVVAALVAAMAWRSPAAGSHRVGVERWSDQVEQQAAACARGEEAGVLLIAPYNREVVLDCPTLVDQP